MRFYKIPILLLMLASVLIAQDTSQTFLSLRNTGVQAFQSKYPDYDGRGTIVIVLDTGVDMGVEGLTTTSTGEVKVIDVQDFTEQGDTPFYEADIEEDNDTLFFINDDENLKVAGADKLSLKSIDDEYYIGVIKESLWLNSGSGASDVNSNGNKKDNFHFVTFQTSDETENFWVVYFDTDADGDLSDEEPIRNYKEKFDAFTIKNNEGLSPFTMGLNIFPDKELVSFYFDDGSHGTHCAGISAGNKIGDNELYGVAPGAYVIGLKLGNNNFSGGATVAESMKKAYLYADKISKEREEPCIINMSFGVGSEIEGHADIEIFLKELVEKNPYLYVATSNGNEGPGLSTSGMPSASKYIFSTGAVLAQEVGNDLYGTTLDRDIILHFSSRGGEVSKPDVVAPGACVSTVPNFSGADRFWGTSMASPYSAGVMSVLLGALKVEYPDVKIPSRLLYKALRESATPMEGYDYVDQGSGLINIEAAYELLKKYIERKEINKFETYTVTSLAPNMPKGRAANLYIRDASFLSGEERFSYRITRDNFNKNNKFYRIYNLKSSADWLKVVQKKVHIRHDQPLSIDATIDKSILDKPGLYNARIDAVRADRSKTPEFDLMATIIVPYQFTSENDYELEFQNEKVLPGMHKRYFLKIPSATSNLNIKVSSDKKDFSFVRYYLHDPDGRQKVFGYLNAKAESGEKIVHFQDIQPGVYEFVVLGQFTSDRESTYNLKFDIDGINILGHSIFNKKLSVVNYFAKAKSYKLSGNVLGYQKLHKVKMNGEKTHVIPFKFKDGESKKIFDISLSKEVYNKLTDFAVMVYNKDGEAKNSGGLSNKDGSLTFERENATSEDEFTFVMIPGFANSPSEIEFYVLEKTKFEKQIDIDVSHAKRSVLTMYPDINYKLNCNFELPKVQLSEGNVFFGEIIFTSRKTDEVELSKQITIK